VQPRIIQIKSIKPEKISLFITKINKLVDYYASKTKSLWTYDTNLVIYQPETIYTNVVLKRINIEREFYHLGMGEIYDNSPFEKKEPMYIIIQNFTRKYYPEYMIINSLIEKLLYDFPEPLVEDDLRAINALYKNMKENETLKSAGEQMSMDGF